MTALQTAGFLLRAAGPTPLAATIVRRQAAARNVLKESERLDPGLIRAVLTGGGEQSWLALAGNPVFTRDHPNEAVELAAVGDPMIGTVLLRRDDPTVRAAVLATADPTDPGWRAPGALLERPDELIRSRQGPQLVGASPFTEIDERFLRLGRRQQQLQLAAFANLWHRVGRAKVVELSSGNPQLGPLVAELVAAALAADDGPAHLARSRQWLETAAASVPRLRALDQNSESDPELPLDWSAVRAAHAEDPFAVRVVRTLFERADCPEEFAIELFEQFGSQHLTRYAGPIGLLVLGYLAKRVEAPAALEFETLREGLAKALESGAVSAVDVVERLTPVRVLLAAATAQPANAASKPLCDEIGARVVGTVGADEAAWRALAELSPSWSGTLPELLTAARDAAAEAAGTAAESRAGVDLFGVDATARSAKLASKPPTRRSRSAADWQPLRDVALCCSGKIAFEILPFIGERAAADLLIRRTPDAEFIAEVLAGGDLAMLRWLADNRALPADAFAPLLAFDDAEINAGLYRNPRASAALRRRIVAGLRHDQPDSGEPGQLPLSDRLRKYLLTLNARRFLLPLIESGITELALHVLRKTPMPTQALELRLILAVARREGLPAARALLDADLTDRAYRRSPWRDRVRRAALKALGGADDAVAIQALQDRIRKETTPEKWIERLRRADPDSGDLYVLDAEQYQRDWALLFAEDARHPLANRRITADYLREQPDCPEDLATRWESNDPAEGAGAAASEPAELANWYGNWQTLAGQAIAAGLAPTDEVIAVARPAGRMIEVSEFQEWWPGPESPLTALCRQVLGENVDAWLLAFELIDDFPGSFAELLSTAAVATSAVSVPAG